MDSCPHQNLELLPEKKNKLRCHHCHLTIEADELQGRHCPECYESKGKKHYDFEELEEEKKERTRYRCEDCGVIIETDF